MSLTYEKAKELKEAGFPQEVRDGILSDKGIPTEDKWSGVVYIPTLSELIEACEEFQGLTIRPSGWRAWSNRKTGRMDAPMGMKGPMFEEIVAVDDAPSPEEAVANLWLVLNKK